MVPGQFIGSSVDVLEEPDPISNTIEAFNDQFGAHFRFLVHLPVSSVPS